jgi:tetratricopeptide (TPR) repeat protein
MTDPDEARIRDEDEAGDAAAARQLGVIFEGRDELDEAEAAYERAAERGDIEALGKLAILIDVHRDDPEAAEAAYRRADEAGSVDGAGNLGRILKERGDLAGAEEAFRRCVERGSVRALADYAGLLSMREDASEAEIVAVVRRLCPVEDRFNREVRGGGDGMIEAAAPVMVFEGMWERCDLAAMEAGVRAADADGSAAGAYRLGLLLQERGDLDGALAAYQRADAAGDGRGSFDLGVELLNRGRFEDAEAAFARAEERGIENAAAGRESARSKLGLQPIERGREPGETLWDWGLRLERLGDLRGTGLAYNEAINEEGQPTAPLATLRYAEILEGRGDPAAEEAFERAAEANDPAIRAGAWRGISSFRAGRGETTAALEALQIVVETGEPDETPRALRNIGTFREELGDIEGARVAYQAAIEHDHPKHSQGARVNMAQLLDQEGDHSQAARLFREAIESEHPAEAPRARVLLGQMLQEQGDDEQALAWYESAMAGENEEWAQRAAFNAGAIYLLQRGEFDRAADAFRLAEGINEERQSLFAACMRGDAERQAGNDHEALAAYFRVVDAAADVAGPARFGAAKQAGIILMKREADARARELFTIAAGAEDRAERARGFLLLGTCERGLGNRGAAITAFEQAYNTAGAPDDVRQLARQGLSEL